MKIIKTVFVFGLIYITNNVVYGLKKVGLNSLKFKDRVKDMNLELISLNKINNINDNNFSLRTLTPKRHYTTFLEKCVQPIEVRNMIYTNVNENYRYLTYTKSKQVLREHANMIDIYGDNVEEMNLEHIFPQYMFKNDERRKEMKSDIHNLFLCNTKLNTYRSNFRYVKPCEYLKYSNDTKCSVLDMKGNKVTSSEDIFRHSGYLMAVNSKRKVFVPTEYSRGKIARALAYFSIKYNYVDKLSEIIDLKTMIEWNFKDPVTNDEYLKNVITYMYQGNLNPFIMDPDLLHFAFLDKVEIDEMMLSERKTMKIDPFYTIEYLINEIKKINEKNIKLEKFFNLIDKIRKDK